MGRVFVVEVEGRSYRCRYCHTSLALTEDVLSRSFSCSHGKAYLVHKVVNITVGPVEERIMFTGTHTVSDIFCCCCGQILGWKYVTAHDKAQKYKEGKYVLERWRIVEEGIDEVNADARLSLSDAENA
ncbi:Protein yippee-like [Camellia lanceoleosa]|uniref:Protein yippee-like n=1 Tax=Camellia lanceoleosa TaxID=1840588 RepID=A0ACC0GL24_9ERIC|nr:Protein yippee-like [Camellia lanceoleosa]